MKRRATSIALAMLVALGLPRLAHGQYYPATALHHPTSTASALDGDARRAQRASSDRVAHDALVGAGVGAGVGLIAAVVATTRPSVTDHSEDLIAYVLFVPLGAGLGLVAGAVVGLVRQ